MAERADVVVTMGCGLKDPLKPGQNRLFTRFHRRVTGSQPGGFPNS
jgi:hypothetical protein